MKLSCNKLRRPTLPYLEIAANSELIPRRALAPVPNFYAKVGIATVCLLFVSSGPREQCRRGHLHRTKWS